jgi:hypothetical protein
MVSILFLSQFPLLAQQKWGKISKEILTMDYFEADTTADAVILFDVAEEEITEDNIKLRRHVRIKILSEEGKSYADVKIPYYHEDRVEDIKAQAVSPRGKKTKLKGDNIFEEKINRYLKGKVFAIPGVEIGSVIEYKYMLTSEYYTILDPWYFQSDCYTQVSEFAIKLDPRFNYNVFYQNVYGEDAEPERSEYLIPGGITRSGIRVAWRIENIPPITSEPYMKNVDDYRMALFFQLLEYRSPYSYVKFIAEWDDLAKKVHNHFKQFYSRKGSLKDKIEELCPDSLSSENKIRLLYNFVRDEIDTKWIHSIWLDRSPEEVLEKRIGDISEKNMLLISLLRHAGIEAHPILISTRKNGILRTNWPQLQQFNLVLAYVNVEGKEYFLDACDQYCPYNILPENDLVEFGFLIMKENSRFIKMPKASKINLKYCKSNGELLENGKLVYHCDFRYEGYEAMKMRRKLMNEDVNDYLTDWLSDKFAQVSLDSFQVQDLENIDLPLRISIDFSAEEYAQVIGDMIYFNPPQVNRLGSNPFKREVRNFPVDYSYLAGINEELTLTLPEGYLIEELPPFKLIKINGGHFLCDCSQEGNVVTFRRQFLIKKLSFPPREYSNLRDFHAQIVNMEEGQVVLTRNSETK